MATKRLKKLLRNSHRARTKVAQGLTRTKGKVFTYAKKNPFKTIGISALAGLLIAQIVRRH